MYAFSEATQDFRSAFWANLKWGQRMAIVPMEAVNLKWVSIFEFCNFVRKRRVRLRPPKGRRIQTPTPAHTWAVTGCDAWS